MKGVQKSMGKELFTEELKIAVVQYVLEGHTRKETSEKFCVSCTPIESYMAQKDLQAEIWWADKKALMANFV